MGFLSNSRFGKLLSSVKKGLERLTNKYSYDFWDDIQNNEIAKSTRPEKEAVAWYRSQYMNNPDRQLKRRIMMPGTLCIFDYDNPKYKDVLDFYDTQPLVLCLTPFMTKDEKVRVLGINLHLLPPRIRKLVLYQAFYLYKAEYTAKLANNKNSDRMQVNINWRSIKRQLEQYGAGFAIRMYLPSLQKNVIEFTQEDWAKAVYIPSKGYAKIGPAKLEQKWREFVKQQGRKVKTAGDGHTSSV